MGCSSCAAASAARNLNIQNNIQRQQRNLIPECEYTINLLTVWNEKLYYIKNAGLFSAINSTEAEINGYIGVVLSAMKNETRICYFKSHLDSISTTIIKIINLQNESV